MLERCSQPPVFRIACHHSMELWRSIKETTGIELNHAQKWAGDAEKDDEKNSDFNKPWQIKSLSRKSSQALHQTHPIVQKYC